MVNKVTLVGRLGADPEIRHFDNDTVVANFNLATSESYKDRDGNRIEQTEWHRVSVWRGLAKVAEKYLKKGDMLYVEGKIRTRQWDDKDGNKRYSTEIQADNFKMLGLKSESSPAPETIQNSSASSSTQQAPKFEQSTPSTPESVEDIADDLPF